MVMLIPLFVIPSNIFLYTKNMTLKYLIFFFIPSITLE